MRFCSKKRSSTCPRGACDSAPPGFQVQVCPAEALQHLQRLGNATLTARTCGLSLMKKTPVGLLNGFPGQRMASSHGLSLDFSQLALTLFCCPHRRCLRVALSRQGGEVLADLSYESHPWEGASTTGLKEVLQATSPAHDDGCLARCDRWLDDWSTESPKAQSPVDLDSLASLLTRSTRLKVCLERQGFRLESQLLPTFVDFDHRVVRLSDRHCSQVLFADLSRASFTSGEDGLMISS